MSKISIILNDGYELDIDKNIPFSLTYDLQSISKPQKKKSAFSKTIKLIGSKNNNKILGHLFNIDSTGFFNVNIKTKAKIVIDSIIVIEGFLQLKKINKLSNLNSEGNLIDYDVVINDNTIDLMSSIEGKELTDLDLSIFDHTFTQSSIEGSWTNTYKEGYVYPLLYNGLNDYVIEDFAPAIYYRTYLEKILTEASYSFGGSLFDNEMFNREIIPFNNGSLTITPEEIYKRKFWVGNLTNNTINSGIYLNNQLDSGQNSIDYMTDESSSFYSGNRNFFDDNNQWSGGSTWTVNKTGNYDIVLNVNYDLHWDTNFEIILIENVSGGFINIELSAPHQLLDGTTIKIDGTINYNGTYIISNITSNSFYIVHADNGSELTGNIHVNVTQQRYNLNGLNKINTAINNPPYFIIKTFMFVNGVQFQGGNPSGEIDYSSIPYLYSLDTGTFTGVNNPGFLCHTGNNWDASKVFSRKVTLPNLTLVTNDVVTFEYSIINASTSIYNNAIDINGISVPLNFKFKIGALPFNGTVTGLQVNPPTSSLTGEDEIVIKNVVPKNFKQRSIIDDLFARYNIIMRVDKDDSKKILFDSRDDYYAAGETISWSDKKDYGQKDVIKFLSDLVKKETLYTYLEDKDDRNKNHTLLNGGDIFGQKLIKYDNNFVKGTHKVESVFASTILVEGDFYGNKIVPFIKAENTGFKPRILQYGGLKTSLNNSMWELTYYDTIPYFPILTAVTYTQYPYAGYLDDPFTGTTSNLFGAPIVNYYTDSLVETNNTLYQRYWLNYAHEIATSKMVTSYYNLSPADISYISKNLNAKIEVDNTFYRVSKIYDYDPTSTTKLTKVDLIKIVPVFTFKEDVHPTPTGKTITHTDVTFKTATGEFTKTQYSLEIGTSRNNNLMSPNLLISGSGNRVLQNSDGAVIFGNNNTIGASTPNSMILGGTDSQIESGVKNVFLLGTSGKTATQDGEIFIGNDVSVIDGAITVKTLVISSGGTAPDFCETGIKTSSISACTDSLTISNDEGDFFASFSINQNIYGGRGTNGISGDESAVIMGKNNIVNANNSAIIGGNNNELDGNNSVILGGNGIAGSEDNTVYVPNLNIKNGIQFGSGPIQIKVELEIGTWDMVSDSSKNVTHSLSVTEWKTIRDVNILIRNDADDEYRPNDYDNGSVTPGAYYFNDTSFFALRSSYFVNSDYNALGYNRGWITFWYTPDT